MNDAVQLSRRCGPDQAQAAVTHICEASVEFPYRDGMMDQLERVLSVASGDQLAYTSNAAEWTAQRTQVHISPFSTSIVLSVTANVATVTCLHALIWWPHVRSAHDCRPWQVCCTSCCTRTQTQPSA